MLNNHSCFIHKHRDSDWHRGDGNISPGKFGAIASGSWTPYVHYFERQKFTYDNDGCIIYGGQEDIDAYLDYQIQMGLIPAQTIALWTQMGFMDSVNSLDGKPHFHSSMLFVFRNTGNGFNGNSLQDPLDAVRKFGIIPWTSLPFDETITQAECLAKNPQNLLDIGQQFLLSAGGKNWLQYHWINDGGPTDTQAMDEARQQAPLMIAVCALAPDWNQYEPPINGDNPNHGMMNHDGDGFGDEDILDHYDPFVKRLKKGWIIKYVIQAIINIVPPPPAPTLPPNPTQAQEVTWLQQLKSWLLNLYERMFDGERLQGASRSPKWPEFKKEYAKTHLPVCAVCGGTKKLNLHHLQPFHAFPELELDVENVTWLCNKNLCHIRIGHLSDFKSINPNGKDDIVAWRDKIRNRPMTVEDIKRSFNKQ